MSAVIYARVPDSLKQALQAHAAERGLTLTAALVALLGQGLEALTQQTSVAELEAHLALATSERAQAHVQLQQAELRLQAAREREQTSARSYRALAERTRQQLGFCPRCREPMHGDDLLVRGHCPNPNCRMALTSLLLPARAVDPNEYLALLGALGVLVGVALATSAEPTG